MYKKILVPVDNSKYSNYCTSLGIVLAEKFGAELTGSHVYSAGLHDRRFRDMEVGLPKHYQEEERLRKSRKIHDSLIVDGLKLISEAYIESFRKGCAEAGVRFNSKLMEGKNWLEILKDVRGSGYDLVIMGILGLGAVNGNLIGGVCERVARKVRTDVLVVKESFNGGKKIVAAIDGSPESFLAFKKALLFGKALDLKVEAVSVYDPHFHRRAFQALVGVLSDEAGKMFKFTEQEKLHDEIIDDGLGKIYQEHLDRAHLVALKEGIDIKTVLLAGKAYSEIHQYLEKDPPSLLVVSRFGAHQTEEMDIGNTAENLLRLAPCSVLLTCEAGTA
jgi:nucleotide-binding universal stress UspA family protein